MAVIDIGTNSMRMLITKIVGNNIVCKTKFVKVTRLGQGVNEFKKINMEAIQRNVQGLKEFKEIAIKNNVDKIYIFGTSALRDARNRNELIEKVSTELNLNIQVIEGNKEAKYGYLGVTNDFTDKNIIVIDIGGGSTEFIKGCEKQIQFMTSLDIGAVRLTEKFILNDPVTEKEIKNIEEYVRNMIIPLKDKIEVKNNTKLISIGGTATTLSAINQKLQVYNAEAVHKSRVNYNQLTNIINKLKIKTIRQRKEIIGLHPDRADIILSGAVIMKEIMKLFKFDKFTVSESDNLEGLAINLLKN